MPGPESVNGMADFSAQRFGSPARPQNLVNEEIKQEATDLTADQYDQL